MSPARRRPGDGGDALAPAAADLLARGDIEVKGRIPWSSNATFLVEVTSTTGHDGAGRQQVASRSELAIYKPERGERPLWDFDRALWRREVAAYQLSQYLGWDLVPVTVACLDGPLGRGSLQLYVEASPDEHYFTLLEKPLYHDQLRRVALFDVLTNNADRKSGHCLLGAGEHIWGIDHGLTFHPEPKLRTVIWDFAGQKVDARLLEDIAPLAEGTLPPALERLLSAKEASALCERAAALVRRRKFPRPLGDFPYPWPLV